MFEALLKNLIGSLLETLPADKVRQAADAALDKIENAVLASPNKLDDAIVLPLIRKAIREPFGIADNDPPAESGSEPAATV